MQKVHWTLLGLAAASVVLSLVLDVQGYRSRLNGFSNDQIVNADEALRLLHGQGVPRMGGLCSFGSYIPPGSAWLILPGVLTGEPRLHELVGPLIYTLGTVAGLYLLVRRCADPPAALFAAALYAISALGIRFGSSLWPRAHPCAYVWMTYFAVVWIQRRSAWHLTAALVTYAIGCLIYLEMAPSLVLFAIAWWAYRPPVRPLLIYIAVVVSVIIWLSYFAFEWNRNFLDLRSQLLAKPVHENNFVELARFGDEIKAWDPERQELGRFKPEIAESPTPLVRIARVLAVRSTQAARNLLNNFIEDDWLGLFPGLIFLAAYIAAASWRFRLSKFFAQQAWIEKVGWMLMVAALLANPLLAQRVAGKSLGSGAEMLILKCEVGLFALGLLLVMRRRVAAGLERAEAFCHAALSGDDAAGVRLLLLLVVGPWLALAILAAQVKYLWGYWPLQVAVLSTLVVSLPARRGWSRRASIVLATVVFASLALNGMVFRRIGDWSREGFAGVDRPEIQAADFLAGQLRQPGREQARVGYLLFFNGRESTAQDIDPRYHVGGGIEHYLALRYGYRQPQQPAQGYSPGDDFRLVETEPTEQRKFATLRFRFADQVNYQLLEQFGTIQVWQRKSPES